MNEFEMENTDRQDECNAAQVEEQLDISDCYPTNLVKEITNQKAKARKRPTVFKIILLSLLSIGIVYFGVKNILWKIQYSYIHSICETMNVENIAGEIRYSIVENGYQFYGHDINYMDFVMNLQVNECSYEKDVSVILFIWPSKFEKTEFGIMIDVYDEPKEEGDRVMSFFTSYGVYFDKDGNPLYKEEDTLVYRRFLQKLVEEHREEIDGTFAAARAKWPELFE